MKLSLNLKKEYSYLLFFVGNNNAFTVTRSVGAVKSTNFVFFHYFNVWVRIPLFHHIITGTVVTFKFGMYLNNVTDTPKYNLNSKLIRVWSPNYFTNQNRQKKTFFLMKNFFFFCSMVCHFGASITLVVVHEILHNLTMINFEQRGN